MRYNIDLATTRSISGWCVGTAKLIDVRCFRNNHLLGRSAGSFTHRPDVQAAYPNDPFSLVSGFSIHFDRPIDSAGDCHIEFEFADGSAKTTTQFALRSVRDLELPAMLRIDQADAAHYLLFLTTMWHKFSLIEHLFPKYNEAVTPGSKDELCVASSAIEMLHIADQLYRLTKAGVSGPVCEFGCFKGFSTSCLSHACFELGLHLEVFDSFAGLPACESAYYADGDYCGTLEEVTRNVRTYGKLEVVRLSKGYFSQSLDGSILNPLLIWMDVDLQASSRDVMRILGQLPRESCVMSHECFPRNFSGGRIVPDGGEDEVITPILEAMKRESRSVQGAWLVGGLAAFWDREAGLQPLSNAALMEALQLARS